jgi:archaemetzincin
MGPRETPPRIDAIRLARIDDIPGGLCEEICARLSRQVGVPCSVTSFPAEEDLPWLAGRADQLDADRLLRRLEERATDPDSVLVGITHHDLGIQIFTFVFGRARHSGRAAVVSTARLDPEYYGLRADRNLALQRTVEEILHEVGHLAGLRHCEDFGCRMYFAASVEAVDLRGARFCRNCTERLPSGLRPLRIA